MCKTYLITGANGFIGSHLIESLTKLNLKIICIDKIFSENFNDKFRSYINNNLIQLEINILDKESIQNVINKYNPNTIIHLAGFLDRSSDISAFATAMDVNYYGTLNLLNAVIKCEHLENILLFGTADEYGDIGGTFEEDSKVSPLSPYGISKNAACNLAIAYHSIHKLPVNVIRPSIAYGPGQKGNMFIPSLIVSLLNNKKFKMSGGEQYRNFIYIDDLIEAVLLIINNKNIDGEIINIGSSVSIKLKEVALKIGTLLNNSDKLEIGALPYRETEIMHYHLEVDKAKELVGFSASHSIDEGLNKTIDFYVKTNS